MHKALRGPNMAISYLSQILCFGGVPLLWTSESDYPLHTVAFDRYTVSKWEKETVDGRPIHPLFEVGGQMRGIAPEPFTIDDYGGDSLTLGKYLLLYDVFNSTAGFECAVFKRPTAELSIYDLFLLIQFSGEWIGLKTKVVET
ncbi:hypothetical protein [Fibrivirga algicola]|uniref:Uncharacterized protein n=1 Tax=Fibrivirga algicola TaxID=2950420 RepID=A0ABX0QDM3_9BACT|nr:hypothetical protein [Fibrivirga algicola]NID09351.1 hypothetical protein [Fibrivirga algicola]